MSNRSKRGTGSHLSKKPARSLKATAALIGGAGIIVAAPGAALLASPPEAQAQIDLTSITSIFTGGAGLSGTTGALVGTATGLTDPIFAFLGGIPLVGAFIGNGADGTAANPNGGNAGILAGNGGDGYSPTVAVDGFGVSGGNGGNAGLFWGSGGNGGNGTVGNAVLGVDGGNGGNGGAGAVFGFGNGGVGGGGGGGGGGVNGVNPTATTTAGFDPVTGNGLDGVGLQNGGNGLNGNQNFVANGGNGGAGGDAGGNGGNGGNGAAGDGVQPCRRRRQRRRRPVRRR